MPLKFTLSFDLHNNILREGHSLQIAFGHTKLPTILHNESTDILAIILQLRNVSIGCEEFK